MSLPFSNLYLFINFNKFEAGWALTNIASRSPEETKSVVDSGAVLRFVQLIESPSDNVREQVSILLGYYWDIIQ